MERLLDDHRNTELTDYTMSKIRETETEHLKQRLTDANALSIFGRDSSRHWMEAYRYSYDFIESGGSDWPTLQTLRSRVKKRLPVELTLITEREENLLKRLLLFAGASPLFSDDETVPADSLLKRLWCSIEIREEGQLFLRLADVLLKPMLALFSADGYQEGRTRLYALSATLHSMVYLHGMLYAEPAITNLSARILSQIDESGMQMLYRYLMADFDYCRDDQGHLVLMHPGLANPGRMLASISNARYQASDYTREMIIGGMSELLKEESAAANILQSELGFALQPGCNPTAMVNDLKILIKQGATHEQLSALIRDKLAIRMTPSLENALLKIEADTVRWQSAPARRLN